MEMCRFFGVEDPGYEKLKLALEGLMARAGQSSLSIQ